ncbi:DNA-binding protein [Nocardioides gansuensis]|uniref:DNA-binding protein n=1 Tax=Nocardioides gansuensis TaxID=2138300 RepID=A0A2T8F9Y6_9ACTN|nr:helix-turn-helix domain-containing protein [Nocardioides gansuensis]PVG82544.1 DNA-binding protein [Nocardioides gansuensis]
MTTSLPSRAAQRGSERLLTMTEVCDHLGISRSTFYDWRQAHKAPPCVVLPNGQIRVREGELDAWVAAHLESS